MIKLGPSLPDQSDWSGWSDKARDETMPFFS